MKTIYDVFKEPVDGKKARISYSQFSMYNKCPKQWELSYIKKLSPYQASVHTVFGTALHETIQRWLTVLYNEGVKQSEQLNLHNILRDNMLSAFKAEQEKSENKEFCTAADLKDIYNDGVAILDWIQKKRNVYFSRKNIQLIGVELPLNIVVTDKNTNVVMVGYLDVVLYDADLNKYIIIDIKTSTRGWTPEDKKDKLKTSQLVLYKEFLSRQLGIPAEHIDVQFFVVRRKIYTNSAFPPKRVQEIKPASGTVTRKKLINEIESFIEYAFYADGSKNDSHEYKAIAGTKNKNCKFCPFKDRYDLCPIEKRLATI